MGLKVLLLGAPGTGKSTVGQALAAEFDWSWISSGEILRSSSEKWIQERLKTGELFDDLTVSELVFEKLLVVPNAFIDGFPRTLRQAEILIAEEVKIDLIIEIEVPEEEIMARLALRGREADKPEIIKARIDDYVKRKKEITDFLREHGVKMDCVDGVGTMEEVRERVKTVVLEMSGGEE